MYLIPQRDRSWLVGSLIVLGVLSRLVPHPPNVTPLTAIALFGGTYLSKRWGLLLPLMTVILSDVVLGGDWTLVFNWTAFALVGLIAWWLRRHPTPGRVAASAVAGSVLFFLVTNIGVWVGGLLYPRTMGGLRDCFVAAIPFFRNTLLGDVVYTAVLFGAYALVTSPRLQRRAINAP
jgi:hypothetical protein